MLLNLSNHPYSTWQKEQCQAAKELFGGVADMPFPNVDPYADETEIMEIAETYFQKIQTEYSAEIAAVHLMGELCFCFELARLLQSIGIKVVASTTERKVIEQEEGQKTVVFHFIRFREYASL